MPATSLQKILGIDPGLATLGFGLVTFCAIRKTMETGPWGVIATAKTQSDGYRLAEIQRDLSQLIDDLQPDMVSLERIFFFKNAKTLVPVTQARGVILMVLHQKGIPVAEYTPMQVKQAITGYGKSQKREIQETVQQMLGLDKLPRPDDAADALALAVCHANHSQGHGVAAVEPAVSFA